MTLPAAYEATWPELPQLIIRGYGWDALEWAPTLWMVLLGLVIFALTRAAFFLVVSVVGLVLALGVLLGRRRPSA